MSLVSDAPYSVLSSYFDDVRGTEVEWRFILPREVGVSFNDDTMFQAASDTCHYSIGRRARDVASLGPCN